jgi:hypothetical protein
MTKHETLHYMGIQADNLIHTAYALFWSSICSMRVN